MFLIDPRLFFICCASGMPNIPTFFLSNISDLSQFLFIITKGISINTCFLYIFLIGLFLYNVIQTFPFLKLKNSIFLVNNFEKDADAAERLQAVGTKFCKINKLHLGSDAPA